MCSLPACFRTRVASAAEMFVIMGAYVTHRPGRALIDKNGGTIECVDAAKPASGQGHFRIRAAHLVVQMDDTPDLLVDHRVPDLLEELTRRPSFRFRTIFLVPFFKAPFLAGRLPRPARGLAANTTTPGLGRQPS